MSWSLYTRRFLVGLTLAIAFLAVVVWVGHPAAIQAQAGELSLRSLADRLESLSKRVDALEAVRAAGLTDEERCGIGVFQTLRDNTVLAYKNAYGEWPRMDRVYIRFVEFAPETKSTMILYEEYIEDRWVMETWTGCTFREASDWWDE